MTNYGSSSDEWAICVCDNISGTPSVPAADYVWLASKNFKVNGKRLSNIITLPNGSSFSTQLGKKTTKMTGIFRVLKKDATSVYNDVRVIHGHLEDWRGEGVDPIYLFVVFIDGATPYYFPFEDENGVVKDYLKGYVQSFDWDFKTGKEIYLKLTFEECLD